MSTDDGSQLESLWDSCAAFVLNAYDAYGWMVPALLLTLLFFTVLALICWALEGIELDLPVFEGPVAIFGWCRKNWQSQGKAITLSITPLRSSPSAPPPSSARE